jgi:dolichyldiphosphatase
MSARAVVELLLGHSRYVVSLSAFATLLKCNDARATFCVAGAVANALANKVLKRLIAQARPAGAQLHDPGMPSSHASSLFFFAAYLALASLRSRTPTAPLLAVLLLAVASAAARHRISAGLHTRAQVVVGAALGSAAAVVWHELGRQRLEAVFAGYGVALAVAGIVGVGIMGNGTSELLERRSRSAPRRV